MSHKRLIPSPLSLTVVAMIGFGAIVAAEPVGEGPAISKFAPAPDLISQAQAFLASITEALDDATAFDANRDAVVRDARTLEVLAVALARHDEQHSLRGAARAVGAAARSLAEAEDHVAASERAKALKAAFESSQGNPEPPTFAEDLVAFGPVMQQVELTHARLKRGLRRFDSGKKEEYARLATILAVVGQAIEPNRSYAAGAEQENSWQTMSREMRDAGGELNAASHSGDKERVTKALERVAKNCADCHASFRNE